MLEHADEVLKGEIWTLHPKFFGLPVRRWQKNHKLVSLSPCLYKSVNFTKVLNHAVDRTVGKKRQEILG